MHESVGIGKCVHVVARARLCTRATTHVCTHVRMSTHKSHYWWPTIPLFMADSSTFFRYLMTLVPDLDADRILLDTWSLDTIGISDLDMRRHRRPHVQHMGCRALAAVLGQTLLLWGLGIVTLSWGTRTRHCNAAMGHQDSAL